MSDESDYIPPPRATNSSVVVLIVVIAMLLMVLLASAGWLFLRFNLAAAERARLEAIQARHELRALQAAEAVKRAAQQPAGNLPVEAPQQP